MTVNDTVDGAQQPQPSPVEALGPYDIICGRNKLAFNNIGNRRFRVTVQLTMDRYMAATTRNETSKVIKYVADIVKENGGRFLRLSPNGKHWIELDKKHIHEKVGHALRDAAPKRESDSTTADTFPYTRSYSSSAIAHLQQDSNNLLNTSLKRPTTHRRPRDTSTLSRRQFRVSTMDQLIPASRPYGESTFDSTDQNAVQKTLGGQEEDSKPPAKQLESKRNNAMEPTSSLKNTPKVHVIHRTPTDSSILSRKQMLSPSALEQWISTNFTTLNSTEHGTALQPPYGGQNDATKLPAMPQQHQEAHQEHQVDSIKPSSSISPKESRKSTKPTIPDASGTGEYETFDDSPFGDHPDADFEW